jgi:PAS domain S-box-containing protein
MEEELGNGWAEGVHPDDLQRCVQTYKQSFDRQENLRMEYRLRRHYGEYRWVLDIGVPRFNQDRSFAGYIGIGIDVTERKNAEESLRASEEKLRLAQSAARIGTFEWNIQTGGNTWTAELEAMYGLPPGGFAGTQTAFEKLVHPEDRARLKELVEATLKTGQPTEGEWRVIWADGSIHWIAGRWQALTDKSGEPSRVVGVNIDITERRRAEDAIHESEERFRLVANTAPVMIWMSGLDKKPTYFNQLWLDFTGLSETDLENGLAGIIHPDDYQQCHETYCQGFDQKQPFKKERLRRHDGQYRWMLDIGVPRLHRDGSFAGYIGSCIDVTDHKLAEEALSGMT